MRATSGATRPARAPAELRFTDVGRIEDFPEGELKRVDIPGKDIFVLRTSDGAFFAIKNTCPHQGAPICLGRVDGTFLPSPPGELELGYEQRMIRCPYHAFEYDLESGRALFVPDVKDRLVRYHVEIRDGRVLVSHKGKQADATTTRARGDRSA